VAQDSLLWGLPELGRHNVEGGIQLRGLLPKDHLGHGDSMQRFAPLFLFVLTFVLAGPLQTAPVHAADKQAGGKAVVDDAKPDTPKARPAKAPVPGGPSDKSALWWEDPKIVKSLSLTDEQRKKMAKYLKAYREKALAGQKPAAFHEALVQGNWKGAQSQSEKLAKAAEVSVQTRGRFKIDILKLLSKKQREMLVDKYPRLIYKPWRRAMREAPSR
jgi:Spy/CpxP family protein refolding chaperone